MNHTKWDDPFESTEWPEILVSYVGYNERNYKGGNSLELLQYDKDGLRNDPVYIKMLNY